MIGWYSKFRFLKWGVNEMKIYDFFNGDELHHYKKALVLSFCDKREVLSTGPDNGGIRTDLKAVFNVDINPGAGMGCVMRGKTYEEHMNTIALEDLGLNPAECTGLCTAASMENVSIKTLHFDEFAPFSVTAIVTAGIEHNGGRVGDEADWHESGEDFKEIYPGTINILLHIDANLDEGTLVRSLITCTEAKVAAIQELQAPSCSSNGIATGSGTDGVIVISNPKSDTRLTNAGKNSKLGEFIGKTVKGAVKEALSLQSGLNSQGQHDVLRRLGRFGVTEDNLWDYYKEHEKGNWTRAEFMNQLDHRRKDSLLVTNASLLAYLLDQMEWELLEPAEVCQGARELLFLPELTKMDIQDMKMEETIDKEILLKWIVENYMDNLINILIE